MTREHSNRPPRRRGREPAKYLSEHPIALLQGGYFLATGIWPLLHMRSFETVTGPKADRWLVKTVGALIGVVGAVLISSGRSGRISPEIRLLAGGSAGVLAAIDVIYVARRRISPIYLMDAVAEAAILSAWSRSTGEAPDELPPGAG